MTCLSFTCHTIASATGKPTSKNHTIRALFTCAVPAVSGRQVPYLQLVHILLTDVPMTCRHKRSSNIWSHQLPASLGEPCVVYGAAGPLHYSVMASLKQEG